MPNVNSITSLGPERSEPIFRSDLYPDEADLHQMLTERIATEEDAERKKVLQDGLAYFNEGGRTAATIESAKLAGEMVLKDFIRDYSEVSLPDDAYTVIRALAIIYPYEDPNLDFDLV